MEYHIMKIEAMSIAMPIVDSLDNEIFQPDPEQPLAIFSL
jgi:hypothetical protein